HCNKHFDAKLQLSPQTKPTADVSPKRPHPYLGPYIYLLKVTLNHSPRQNLRPNVSPKVLYASETPGHCNKHFDAKLQLSPQTKPTADVSPKRPHPYLGPYIYLLKVTLNHSPRQNLRPNVSPK
ncbi:10487_t:CDS:2, partial [Cetraspora pellucida]